MNLRPLTSADVYGALRLSTEAGWNQLDADWHRLIALWPDQCVGGWEGDHLVATGTLATYGRAIGWVGMILVKQTNRGRGLGTQMMEAVLALADRFNVRALGLDASDQGRPLYEKLGFTAACPITRWRRRGDVPSSEAWRPGPLCSDDWDTVARLDAAAVGADRSRLLRRLADEHGAVAAVSRGAYAFRRPGRMAAHVGPVVAETTEKGAGVVNALLSGTDGKDVVIDLLAGSALQGSVAELGFRPDRHLTRMVRGSGNGTLISSTVHAAVGFELG